MPHFLTKPDTLKIRTRNALGILVLLSLFLSVAACSSSPGATGKIHLTLWYWNRSIDDNVLAQVDKVFPNVVLNAVKITNYDTQVRTAMAGHYGVPDILGINSNVATYFPDENQFVDLNQFGAASIKNEYLPWKWKLATTPDGKQIALPMDTGPTALFYRPDIFAQAGLPTDPQQVAALFKTWNDYLQAGPKIHTATNGKSYLLDSVDSVYSQQLAQSPQIYFDTSGKYIGDQSYMKQIWDTAVKAQQLGDAAGVETFTTPWNQAASNGLIASFVGAVWMKQILEEAAPNTSGKWRVTNAPNVAGNNGGSFLGVTKASQNPQIAFDVIKWIESPQNQLVAYKDIQLFPSTPSVFNSTSMFTNEPFFGGQDTTKVFASAATQVPITYATPTDPNIQGDFTSELQAVEYQNASPAQTWTIAQQDAQREILIS